MASDIIETRLIDLCRDYEGRKVFTSSFGIEDQLITHFIAKNKLPIEIVTLDTGRLFSETHEVWQKTEDKYGITISGFYPNPESVAKYARINGTNGFYNSHFARQECCNIRKIEPLNRALAGAEVWITGLRADASGARAETKILETDEARNLIKFNPLFDQSREAIISEIIALNVPYNKLHNSGFVSIGCAPCTRAISKGEDERAGRWWWESEEAGKKECGLHISQDGKLIRENHA